VSQHTGTIRDMGLLDLSSAQSAEDLSGITSIHDVGAIIIPEDLMSALIRIDIHDVGSVVPIPRGANVSLHMGQTRLTGEALAAAIDRAADAWADQTLWRSLMQRAMARDYSWNAAARKYLSLYRALLSQ